MKKKVGTKRKNDDVAAVPGDAATNDELYNKAKKRKKTLQEKIEGPSAADKLLPKTLEEKMAAHRVSVVLEKCALELAQPHRGPVELLNCDDHKNLLHKNGRDPSEIRPDILHQCLMTLLDSPLNKSGKLLIYIHTAQNVLIEVHPSLRVPRTFKRFAGLAVELLQRHKIRAAQANETLMKVIANPIDKYLPPGSRRFGFSVSGRQVKFRDFAAQTHQESPSAPLVFAVGGVAHDDPVTEEKFGAGYIEEKISICPWGLSASCCCSKICNEFEHLWDVC
jgi:rRNA small subunit pseudouridine methyltransferase Nep1